MVKEWVVLKEARAAAGVLAFLVSRLFDRGPVVAAGSALLDERVIPARLRVVEGVERQGRTAGRDREHAGQPLVGRLRDIRVQHLRAVGRGDRRRIGRGRGQPKDCDRRPRILVRLAAVRRIADDPAVERVAVVLERGAALARRERTRLSPVTRAERDIRIAGVRDRKLEVDGVDIRVREIERPRLPVEPIAAGRPPVARRAIRIT